jgi:phage gpG-like protein
MADQVVVEGMARFRVTLAAATARIQNPTKALDTAGRLVAQGGQVRAPVVTGRLAGSIRASTADGEAVIGSALPYAGVQEYGWAGHGIAAQPFLRPALDASEALVLRAMEADAQAALSIVKGI